MKITNVIYQQWLNCRRSHISIAEVESDKGTHIVFWNNYASNSDIEKVVVVGVFDCKEKAEIHHAEIVKKLEPGIHWHFYAKCEKCGRNNANCQYHGCIEEKSE